MRKAAFITIHVGLNFGSVLQTIATSEVLQRLGLQPICINYIPPRVLRRYWPKKKLSKYFVNSVLYYPFGEFSRLMFKYYLQRNCRLTSSIYKEDNFAKKCPHADFYITGSDQVWNFIHNEGYDGHYFFDDITGTKISYSSSIGMTNLTEEQKDILKLKLTDYKTLSVREESAKELLASLGLNATHLIDPTIMLNWGAWKAYASRRLIKRPYLFVYLPYNTVDIELAYRTIRKIASKNNLKVVSYSFGIHRDKMADKTVMFAHPGDFLSLMYYADYVVTNSFHGTAFSINLNKRFSVYMPSKFSTRISSLLELCELEKRLLTDEIGEEQLNEDINYDVVNKILDVEREKTIAFLKKAIS